MILFTDSEPGIEIIRRAWTEERFSFQGKRFDLDQITVTPKPLQKPHSSLWIGTMSEEGVKRAARQGDAWLADPIRSLGVLKHMAAVYRDLAARRGIAPRVMLRRDAWVAATKEQALAEYAPTVFSTYRYFWEHGAFQQGFQSSPAGQPVPEFSMERVAAECLVRAVRRSVARSWRTTSASRASRTSSCAFAIPAARPMTR